MNTYPIVLLAQNIRSLWNIGSFFRSADAFGVSHVYLSGYTATPPRKEISKTALGAEQWIPWSYEADPFLVIERLKASDFSIVALERTEASTPLSQWQITAPTCLILGHEIEGVSKELQSASDRVLHIDMLGKKESLNVSVACGIALYQLRTM